MSTTNIVGGLFQNPLGSPVANGTLIMQLSQDAVSTQPSLVTKTPLYISLDANGNINGNVAVWANDQLTPSTTFYTVWALDANRSQVWGPHEELVNSSPDPFDISAWNTFS